MPKLLSIQRIYLLHWKNFTLVIAHWQALRSLFADMHPVKYLFRKIPYLDPLEYGYTLIDKNTLRQYYYNLIYKQQNFEMTLCHHVFLKCKRDKVCSRLILSFLCCEFWKYQNKKNTAAKSRRMISSIEPWTT